MYEQVFHFKSRPFTSTPYVKHYSSHEAIHSSLQAVRMCIDRASGPAMVIGGTGTGKSLLLAMLEEQYHHQFKVVNLSCARLDSRHSLLQSILFELEVPATGASENELRFSLIDFLKPSERCPNGLLLLIDEAHTLTRDLLDEVRLITNFVRDGQPRVRLVMVGNQTLEENMADSKLESFNQRIAARCYLGNMNREDTARYVVEHIDRVGGNGSTMFDQESLREISNVTDGCPRLVNQVCDHALILAATRGETMITDDTVREAWSVVQAIPGLYTPKGAESGESSSQMLEQDSDWTVLEFGSLDDEVTSETEPVSSNEEFQASPTTPINEQVELENHVEPTEDETSWSETDAVDAVEQINVDQHDGWPTQETVELDLVGSLYVDTGAAPESEVVETGNETVEETETGTEQELVPSAETFDSSAEVQDGQETMKALEAAIAGLDESVSKMNQEEPAVGTLEEPVVEQTGSEADHGVAHSHVEDWNAEESLVAEDTIEADDEPGTTETVDPFAETFEEEEHLADRYAPFVAFQNQSSLTITTEDLATLQPIDVEYPGESAEQPQVNADNDETVQSDQFGHEVFNTGETSAETTDEVVETPVRLQPVNPVELAPVNVATPGDSGDSPEDVSQRIPEQPVQQVLSGAEEPSSELSRPTVQVLPVQTETSSGPQPTEQLETETLDLVASLQLDGNNHSANETTGEFHQHLTEATSDEIEHQANQILERLNMPAEEVSHETTFESEQNVSVPDSSSVPAAPALEAPATLNDSQQILNEIMQQRQLIEEVRQAAIQPSGNSDMNIEYPMQGVAARVEGRPVDDREMIVVNRMTQPAVPPKSAASDIPFPDTPISTGRAERMDYQQLFDQLRDTAGESPVG